MSEVDRNTFIHLIDNDDDLETILNEWLAFQYNYDGHSVDIPHELIDSMKAAQERVDELVAMNKEEIQKTAMEYNLAVVQGNTVEELNRNSKIQAVRQELHDLYDWVSDSDEDGAAIISTLHEYLGSLYAPDTSDVLKELSPEEWYSQALKAAVEHQQRKITQYQEEHKRVKELNSTIESIKSYFIHG